VDLDVAGELVVAGEPLAAAVVRALVRLLPSVGPQVAPEVFLPVEVLPAARVRAVERPQPGFSQGQKGWRPPRSSRGAGCHDHGGQG